MAEEEIRASLLTGYRFFRHPNTPTVGYLRLDTKAEPVWVAVTAEGLRQLAQACATHADELEATQ